MLKCYENTKRDSTSKMHFIKMRTLSLLNSTNELQSNLKNFKKSFDDSNNQMNEDLIWFGVWTSKKFDKSLIKSLTLIRSFMSNCLEFLGNLLKIPFLVSWKERLVQDLVWTKTHQLLTVQNTELLKWMKKNQIWPECMNQASVCIRSRTFLS